MYVCFSVMCFLPKFSAKGEGRIGHACMYIYVFSCRYVTACP